MQAQKFCSQYVLNVFGKWDTDKSGVLERQEIKNWMREEIKAKPLRKASVKAGFFELIQGADSNSDGKVDRWELFQHCLKNYVPIEEDSL